MHAKRSVRPSTRPAGTIGKVGQLFLDDETQRPEFITVNTGLFGTNETFVPVADAERSGDRLTVPFEKDKVKDAPNDDPFPRSSSGLGRRRSRPVGPGSGSTS